MFDHSTTKRCGKRPDAAMLYRKSCSGRCLEQHVRLRGTSVCLKLNLQLKTYSRYSAYACALLYQMEESKHVKYELN